ncbi:hypothetical protein E2562_039020 [Oryza meyeriana var. granulata]|uniref:Uncharacterized protein n=1 Tax=Oryza meyeriana var. granulata TaxID=110450 RepID=A0A6G1DTI3_9ORYZ|nr:hypothetical protein E2562_039020 [Oryza meyeriana var. granulata]
MSPTESSATLALTAAITAVTEATNSTIRKALHPDALASENDVAAAMALADTTTAAVMVKAV